MNWIAKKEWFCFPFGFYFTYVCREPINSFEGLNKVDFIAFKAKVVVFPITFNFAKI